MITMATGPRYKVPFRRRREGRTDYRHRAALLRGKLPRAVVRKSNRNITVQLVTYDDKGDKVLASAVSTELADMGWSKSGKSTPGAYLTGLLAGKRAAEKGLETAVLDIGLREPVKGALIFAALKGLVDAGLDIPHSDKMFPSDDRVAGKHMKDAAAMFAEAKKKIGGAEE